MWLIFKLARVTICFPFFPLRFFFCGGFFCLFWFGFGFGFCGKFLLPEESCLSQEFYHPRIPEKKEGGEGAEQDGEGDHSNKSGVITAHYSSTDLRGAAIATCEVLKI